MHHGIDRKDALEWPRCEAPDQGNVARKKVAQLRHGSACTLAHVAVALLRSKALLQNGHGRTTPASILARPRVVSDYQSRAEDHPNDCVP